MITENNSSDWLHMYNTFYMYLYFAHTCIYKLCHEQLTHKLLNFLWGEGEADFSSLQKAKMFVCHNVFNVKSIMRLKTLVPQGL